MFLLAEASQAPNEIKVWLECLAFLVVLVIGVLKLLDRLKPKPEPRDTYTPKTETAKLETTLKQDIGKVETDLKKELKRVDDDVRSLRREIVENGDKRRASIEGKVQQARDEMSKGFTELTGHVSSLSTLTKKQDEQLLVITSRLNQLADNQGNQTRKH